MNRRGRAKNFEVRSVKKFGKLLMKHGDSISRIEVFNKQDFFVLHQTKVGEDQNYLNVVRLSEQGAECIGSNIENMNVSVEKDVNVTVLAKAFAGNSLKSLQFVSIREEAMESTRHIKSLEKLGLTSLDTITRNLCFYKIANLASLTVFGLPANDKKNAHTRVFLDTLKYATSLSYIRLVFHGYTGKKYHGSIDIVVNLEDGLHMAIPLGLIFPRLKRDVQILVAEGLFHNIEEVIFLRVQLLKRIKLFLSRRCECNKWNILADYPSNYERLKAL